MDPMFVDLPDVTGRMTKINKQKKKGNKQQDKIWKIEYTKLSAHNISG